MKRGLVGVYGQSIRRDLENISKSELYCIQIFLADEYKTVLSTKSSLRFPGESCERDWAHLPHKIHPFTFLSSV